MNGTATASAAPTASTTPDAAATVTSDSPIAATTAAAAGFRIITDTDVDNKSVQVTFLLNNIEKKMKWNILFIIVWPFPIEG